MATGRRTGRLAPGHRAPLARPQPVTLAASPCRASASTRANAGRPLPRTRSTARRPLSAPRTRPMNTVRRRAGHRCSPDSTGAWRAAGWPRPRHAARAVMFRPIGRSHPARCPATPGPGASRLAARAAACSDPARSPGSPTSSPIHHGPAGRA